VYSKLLSRIIESTANKANPTPADTGLKAKTEMIEKSPKLQAR
jgi:hypothetical protein